MSATTTADPYAPTDPYVRDPDGNLLRWDGTCGPDPDLIKHQWEWAVFLFGVLIAATATSFANFRIGTRRTFTGRFITLFVIQSFFAVIARLCGTGIIVGITRGGDFDVWKETTLRGALWGAFLGLHPGTIMGILQVFKPYKEEDEQVPQPSQCQWDNPSPWSGYTPPPPPPMQRPMPWNAVAVVQILADMIWTWVGLGQIWKGELGEEPKITNAGNRTRLLAAAWTDGIALFLVLVFWFWTRARKWDFAKYGSLPARVFVCLCSLALCAASLVLTVRGTELCGRTLAKSDGIGSALQMGFSFVLMGFTWNR